MKRAIISVSGGMDSTSLLVNLLNYNYKVTIANFNYGSVQNTTEHKRLMNNIEYLRSKGFDIDFVEMDLSSIMSKFYSSLTRKEIETPEGHYADENMKATVVPNRNAIFASIIYGLALSQAKETGDNVDICLGIHSGDHTIYPDCRPEFINAIYNAFAVGNWDSEKVGLYVPYLNLSKSEVLKDAFENCKNLNLDFDKIMSNTITCYKPNEEGKSCGKCGSCTERLEAFRDLGRKDPVDYVEGVNV